MTRLGSFQQTVARALTALAIIHVPIFAAIAYALGGDTWSIAMLTLVLAAAPIIALALQRPLKIVAFALVIALVGQTSLLVYVFSGHPWQVEMHFYYFAVLAMLSGFCEWCVLVTAAGLIAVHHLSLNFVLPSAIYPGGSNAARVVVHAVMVVVETVMLVRIGHAIRSAFAQVDSARREAQDAAAELKRSGATGELTPEQAKIIKLTFAQAMSRKVQVGLAFYYRLFTIAPETRALFKGDIAAQSRKLMDTLALAVGMLRDMPTLVSTLEALARRHVAYNVRDEHYDKVGAALLWTLERELGAAFTEEARDAWAALYGAVAQIMRKAAAGGTSAKPGTAVA